MYLEFAKKIAIMAGDFLKKSYYEDFDIFKKGDKDLVTQIDYECERLILNEIEKEFPTHSILSEEKGLIDKNSSYKWIIDPLDGTINFSRKIPLFGVIITLMKDNEAIIGAINLPMLNELYYCEKNKGSYLNDKKVFVSETIDFKDTIIGLGDFNIGKDDEMKELDNKILTKTITQFSYETMRTKIFGAACVDMTSVVCGRTDALFYAFSNPWDVLAAELMIKEAGGRVSSYGDITVYSNRNLHDKILENLKMGGC